MTTTSAPTRPCRAQRFDMRRDPWPPQPWVLLSSDDGWEAACRFDDMVAALLSGHWREGALHEVTDAMRAAAQEAVW